MTRFSRCLMLFILLALTNAVLAAQPVEEWNRTYGGQYGDGAWSLHDTDDGVYIFTGYTSSLGQSSDLWLVKTDSQGYMQWNKTFVGSEEDVGYFVEQTADGGYIVTGCTKSYGMGEERLWLLKTDSNGSKEWDHIFGGFVSSSGDGGWAVDQTEDGGFIVTGYTMSDGAGGKDLWLIRTDSAGNTQWVKTFGGPKDDVGMSVIQTRDGGYIVAGRTESVDSGSYKAFLLKTDLYGKKLWERSYGKDSSGISLQQTDDGGFIIAGSMNSPVTGKDAMLIKTDSYGREQWIMPLGGHGKEIGTSVVESLDGGYVMAGITNSFGAGAEDAWLVKVKPENALSASGNAVRNTTFRSTAAADLL